MINTITHDNCELFLKSIKSKSIDFILCDPPYGTTSAEWDKLLDINLIWNECNRILKPDGTIAFFSAQPFTTKLISSNINNYSYSWYWIKNQATNFLNAKKMPLRKLEEICIFNNGRYYPQKTQGHKPTNSAKGSSIGNLYRGDNIRNYKGGDTDRYPTNILEYKCVNNYNRLHPSQKPTDLIEYLIKTYTLQNDIVLDFCAGSGSTGVACINTNRNYILCESDIKFINLIKDRINNHEIKNNINNKFTIF